MRHQVTDVFANFNCFNILKLFLNNFHNLDQRLVHKKLCWAEFKSLRDFWIGFINCTIISQKMLTVIALYIVKYILHVENPRAYSGFFMYCRIGSNILSSTLTKNFYVLIPSIYVQCQPRKLFFDLFPPLSRRSMVNFDFKVGDTIV